MCLESKLNQIYTCVTAVLMYVILFKLAIIIINLQPLIPAKVPTKHVICSVFWLFNTTK